MKKSWKYRSYAASALAAAVMVVITAVSPAAGQNCPFCDLVDSIESSRIISTIRALSGEDPVFADGDWRIINTRYCFSPEKKWATEYLASEALGYGYSPEERDFVLAVDTPDLTGVSLSPDGDTAWVSSLEGGIYISTAGDGWSGFSELAGLQGRLFDLVNCGNSILFAAGRKAGAAYGCIFKSTDSGAGWSMVYDGSISRDMYQFNSVAFWENGFGIAAGHYGSLMTSADWGASWWTAASPDEFEFLNINGVASTGPMHFWAACDRGYLFESVDLGNSWTRRQLSVSLARLSDVDFFDESRGVVVGEGVAFSTDDGGMTWHESAHPADLESVTMIDSQLVVSAGSGGGVWVSLDGGWSWAAVEAECGVMKDAACLAAGADGRVWTAGRNLITRLDPGWPDTPSCGVYEMSDTTFGTNIVFSRKGWKEPKRKILVCGHYDSTNRTTDPMVCAPGADDNGSGTSIVMECARVFAGLPVEKTVEFALFDGEENGLVGSSAFVAAVDTTEAYDAVINIDMVGADYGGDGRIHLGAVEGTPDTVLVQALTAASDDYAILHPLDWQYRTASNQPMTDDLSFKSLEGVPAAALIESGFRDNPHYHNCSDLVDYVDPDYMLDAARIVFAAAARLAGLAAVPSLDVVLHQNRPNPFFSSTGLVFEIPARMRVRVTVYDVSGRRVRRIEDSVYDPGVHPLSWDGLDDSGDEAASGVYFLQLEAGGERRSIKVVRIH